MERDLRISRPHGLGRRRRRRCAAPGRVIRRTWRRMEISEISLISSSNDFSARTPMFSWHQQFRGSLCISEVSACRSFSASNDVQCQCLGLGKRWLLLRLPRLGKRNDLSVARPGSSNWPNQRAVEWNFSVTSHHSGSSCLAFHS